MEKRETLKLKTRRKIYEAILEQPGICIRELERTLSLAMGELTYHLPILLKSKLIQEDNDGYFRRFFSANINEKDKNVFSLLRRDAAKRVIPLFLAVKKITNKELSKALSISPSTASWHIHRMKTNKLLNENKQGNKIYYSLKDRKAINKIYLM